MKSLNINRLIEQVLTNCVPSSQEEQILINCANRVKKRLNSYITDHDLNHFIIDIVFGGSFAKGTWLKNEADIDIFVRFNSNIDYEIFEKYGKQIGIQSLLDYSPYLRYADHPYVEAIIDGIKVNVVPCFDVPFGMWKSAADRSPFHTLYMVDKLSHEQKNQVRVLKQFLKSLQIYGAEISTEGFSGYVCEVLILKFGTFLSTVKFFSTYIYDKMIIRIDENVSTAEKCYEMHDSFIVILDPIDQKRNLGSAISTGSVATLVLASRKFLADPNANYFTVNSNLVIDDRLKNSLVSSIIIIKFGYSNRPSDVIWGQLKKLTKSVIRFSETYGFRILKSTCNVSEKENRCVIGLLLESITISSLFVKEGPEVFRLQDVEKFIEVNQKSPLKWLDNDSRTKCLIFRNHTNIKEYLEFILKNSPNLIGIPKGLKMDLLNSFKIYNPDQNLDFDTDIRNTISKLMYTDDRIF